MIPVDPELGRTDHGVVSSRAVEPFFFRAPYPDVVTPKEYQFAGAEYALARDHALIGDAPGLGKTAEGILVSNALEAKHTLVVCPASLRLNWEREVWTWSTTPNVSTYPVLRAKDGVSLQANYVIISYDLLRNEAILDALMEQQWDHLILDEAHALKDPKGNKRTRIICAPDCLPSVVGRVTMLSGTILPNQPIECYNACRLLNWEAIDCASLEDFREYYYAEGEGFIMKPVVEGGKRVYKKQWSKNVRNVPRNHADLQYRLRKHIMVRRLKEQVLHELPPKQWHVFPLELNADIRQVLKHPGWAAAERLYDMDADLFARNVPIDGDLSTVRRMLGEAKMKQVASYIDELLLSGAEKIVVGAWHRSVLAFLKERLSSWGLRYMDGTTSSTAKQAAVDAFQGDPSVRIILGQMLPLGEGWTLTRAQDVVFAEPDWVPGKNDQLLDRINRMGQTGAYTIGHVPIVPGSLDEKILGTAVWKDQNIHLALDAQV